MRRVILMLACLAGLCVGGLSGAAAVLASGTSTSAGDQQYVDPLTGTGSSNTSHPSGSSGSGSSSSSSSGSLSNSGNSGSSSSVTGNTSVSQSASSTSGSGSSGSTDPSGTGSSASGHGGTLPFTGMNVWACAAIGVGLLGTGIVLRRRVRAH